MRPGLVYRTAVASEERAGKIVTAAGVAPRRELVPAIRQAGRFPDDPRFPQRIPDVGMNVVVFATCLAFETRRESLHAHLSVDRGELPRRWR